MPPLSSATSKIVRANGLFIQRRHLAAFIAVMVLLAGGYAFSPNLRSALASLNLGRTGIMIGAGEGQISAPRVSFAPGLVPFQTCTLGCSATVPATGTAGQAVSFQSTGTPSNCVSGPTFQWSFGNGDTSTSQNPNYTYNTPGTYNWQVTVSASQSGGGGGSNISTVAGGEGEGTAASQTSFFRLTGVARDPQARGIFLTAERSSSNVIYFVNTTASSVSLAGKTFAAGEVRVVAGGGTLFNAENTLGTDVDLATLRSIAVSPDGTLVYFIENGVVRALNVGNVTLTIGGGSLGPANVRTLASNGFGSELAGVAVSPSDSSVFVVDATTGINRVFRIVPSSGNTTIIVGNGAASAKTAPFVPNQADQIPLLQPRAIKFEPNGSLIVADTGHARVIRVSPAASTTTPTLLGQFSTDDGTFLNGLAVAAGGVYVINGNLETVHQVPGGTIAGQSFVACDYQASPPCGDGGQPAAATFAFIGSASLTQEAGSDGDASGIYLIDQSPLSRARIRFINRSGASVTLAGTTVAAGTIQTIAGKGLAFPFDGGPSTGAFLSGPIGVAADANNNLWSSDSNSVNRIRFHNRGASQVTLFAGTGSQQIVPAGTTVTVNNMSGGLGDVIPAIQGNFTNPQGLFATSQGIYVADSTGGPTYPAGFGGQRTSALRFINTSGSTVTFFPSSAAPVTIPAGSMARIAGCEPLPTTCAPLGFARTSRFVGMTDVAVASNGDIYVTAVAEGVVRKISASTGNVTNLSIASSKYTGLGVSPGGRLYIVDTQNGKLLRETAANSNIFTELVTSGLSSPRDVAIGSDNTAYVTLAGSHRITAVTDAGATSTFAGTSQGFSGDGGAATSAKLNISPPTIDVGVSPTTSPQPQTVGIVVASSGDIFFTDTNNNRLRRIGGAAGLVTCVRSGSITINASSNPVPSLTSLSPSTTVAGGSGFQMTVNGSNFINGSVVNWNGSPRTTSFVNSNQLQAQVTTGDIATAGVATVTVFNPAPGGGTSGGSSFTVTNPAPTLSGLNPSSAIAGGIAFSMTVTGNSFVSTSTVQWNGSNRTTTFVNATTLMAAITAADIANSGTANVTVVNPAPGGGTTAPLSFTIAAAGQGFEADVSPRPTGNGSVSLTDYVQIGRFAAGLDTVNVGTEFQKADCAPKDTLGNGSVSLADWVQAGRYASFLDTPVPAAGGPTGPPGVAPLEGPAANLVAAPDQARILSVVNQTIAKGASGNVSVQIVSQGDENTIGFSLAFDTANLTYVSVALAPTLPMGTTLLSNVSQAAAIPTGRIGLAVSLPFGTNLVAGTRELVRITFTAVPAGPASSTQIVFDDTPIARELVRADASTIPNAQTQFLAGTVTLTGGSNPVPTITSLNPTSAVAGSAQFTLTVNGTNFVNGSVVRFAGVDKTTAFVNSTQLTATIPAADVAAAGTPAVTVFNPLPGGGTSNSVNFTVTATNPVPTLTNLNPNTATAGSAAFNLVVTGTNFIPTSVVNFGGIARVTTFNSATQLTAAILASDVQNVGTPGVTVTNPAPGGGTTAPLTFTITATNPVPVITTINPTSATAGGPGFVLTVNGSGFVSGSVVRWNASNRTTTFVNANQLTATITAADIAAVGTGAITVSSPAPGGGVSNTVNLSVTATPSSTVRAVSTSITRGSNGVVAVELVSTGLENAVGFTVAFDTTQLSYVSSAAGSGTVGATVNINAALAGSGLLVVNAAQSPGTTFAAGTRQLLTITFNALASGQAASTQITFPGSPAPNEVSGVSANLLPAVFTAGTVTFSQSNNPVPALTTLAPTATAAGSPAFVLTVNGSNFVNGAVVRWNGSDRVTTFVNANQVTAQITLADVANQGSATVTVFNPAPGGGLSNGLTFNITATNPIPSLTSLNPSSIAAGSGAFSLQVNGGNFLANSVVQWNGVARTTTFNSATQLSAAISAADVATQGSAQVTVVTPAPGGGTSNALTFTISAAANPAPTVTSVVPNSATAGGAQFSAQVNGTNFISGAVVLWNGNPRTTSFVSSTQLNVTITASDIATAGTANIAVTNPAPGGGTSGTVPFTINNPVPAVTSLSPPSVVAGAAAFQLSVIGSNFTPTSTVLWNGSNRTTTFVSSTQITAAIGESDIAGQGSATVAVSNPAPGGGTSNTVTFTISSATSLPVISSLNPNSALAGGSQFSLKVIGSNFQATSKVLWNGQQRNTTFDNSGQLTAIITAADIANGAVNTVTVFTAGVNGGTSNPATFTVTGPNAVPSISALSPSSIAAGSPAFTMTVTGTGFVSGAVVTWNGGNRSTTFVNATTVTAQISAGDVAAQGSAQVSVVNPAPGGGASNELSFTITPGNPVPTLTSLNPSSVASGSGALALTVNGANFVSGAVVSWNGSPRATTFVNSTTLTAQITAGDVANGGTAAVTAFNPGPGGGTSNALTFTIVGPNPVPTIGSLNPPAALVGGPAFVLTVNGTGYVAGSVVNWNGSPRTTTFVGPTQLTAQISAADIASVTSATVTVFNPAPGGGVSNGVAFSVGNLNPAPTLTLMSPNTTAARGGQFTLTATGTGFFAGSVIQWNGGARPTTFVNATTLTAQIPATDIVFPGTAAVTVFNQLPGGGTSTALSFVITNPVPAITGLSPSAALFGGSAFTLQVTGVNFVENSVVRWNGQDRPTGYVNATQLNVQISAADIAAVGTAAVTVFNPAPGGGLSAPATFTIFAPAGAPVISALSPTFVNFGGPAFELTVIGSNFVPTSVVQWNGANRTTVFVSSTALRAQIPAADISFPGSASIRVFSPPPGGGLSLALRFAIARPLANTNAASFVAGSVARESIVAAFGEELATGTSSAATIPLPTSLLGTSVLVKDALGVERASRLFAVSPMQVNYEMPAQTAFGTATVTITSGDNIVSIGQVQVVAVAPGIFSANADGQGPAAAQLIRVSASGGQTTSSVVRLDAGTGKFVAVPIVFGPQTETLYLAFFGTGFRARTALSAVTVTLGGTVIPVPYAGPAPGFIGLDQLNLGPIPRSFIGRGPVNLVVTVDGKVANTVSVTFQ